MKTLLDILSMKRPHGGKNETRVATEILSKLPASTYVNAFMGKSGMPMAWCFCTSEHSKTLFVAHLDTVHNEDGANPVVYDAELEWMYKVDGTALGADDGAGIWVLYKMIEANVPGTYLFTVGEERGGVGAKWMADNMSAWLGTFDRAVTFDRRGTTSVITHQAWGRCCSDEFARALAVQLNEGINETEYPHMGHKPDDTGVYTDTAEFVYLIPECTNISVGYEHEHTAHESLDVGYLKALREAAIKTQWEELPTKRDVRDVEDASWGIPMGSWARMDDVDDPYRQLQSMDVRDVSDFVYNDPEAAIELLLAIKDY